MNIQLKIKFMNEKIENIMKKIKLLRKKKGKTQKQFGKVFGVSAQQIHKYEANKNTLSLEFFLEICRYFNIEPEVLLKDDEKIEKSV